MRKRQMSSNDPCRKSDTERVTELANDIKHALVILPEIEPGELYGGIIVYRRGDVTKPLSVKITIEFTPDEE